eukprot:gene26839-4439_t
MSEFPRGAADVGALPGPIVCYNLLPMAMLFAFTSFPITAMAASPPPNVPDCSVGNDQVRASCYCNSADPKLYADKQNKCQGFFTCVDGTPGVYAACLPEDVC